PARRPGARGGRRRGPRHPAGEPGERRRHSGGDAFLPGHHARRLADPGPRRRPGAPAGAAALHRLTMRALVSAHALCLLGCTSLLGVDGDYRVDSGEGGASTATTDAVASASATSGPGGGGGGGAAV